MRLAARVLALVAVLAMAGCVKPPPLLTPPLPPQTLGDSITARQQVTIRFDGSERSMQVALKVAPDELTLIGLTAIGQRLFTLSWDGRQAQLSSTLDSIAAIDPQRILADLQLAYWPLPALRAALPNSIHLQQMGTTRLLWRDGRLLWLATGESADRWGSSLLIYNARAGYRLTIQPLSLDEESP